MATQIINRIAIGGNTGVITLPYGTCSTAASTAAKTTTITGAVLETGAMVAVKFTNANTAANPTLNVSSTGAKSIYQYGTTAIGGSANTSWKAGAVVIFVYDGSGWVSMSAPRAANVDDGSL